MENMQGHKIIVNFTVRGSDNIGVEIVGMPNPVQSEVTLKEGRLHWKYGSVEISEACALEDLHKQSGEFVDSFMKGLEPVLSMNGMTLGDCGVNVDCKVCNPEIVH